MSTTRLALAASSRCGKGGIKKIRQDKAGGYLNIPIYYLSKGKSKESTSIDKNKPKKQAIDKGFLYYINRLFPSRELEVDPN